MKIFKKLLCTLVATLLCLCAFTACGNSIADDPTPTYTAFYSYLEALGGERKYEDLKDAKYGEFDLTFTTMSTYIWVYAFYSNKETYNHLHLDFYRDKNHPVSVSYSETYKTSSQLDLTLRGTSTDLSSSWKLSVTEAVYSYNYGEEMELTATNELYPALMSTAQAYIQNVITWISTTLQVVLDNNSVDVHDLYVRS